MHTPPTKTIHNWDDIDWQPIQTRPNGWYVAKCIDKSNKDRYFMTCFNTYDHILDNFGLIPSFWSTYYEN